MGTHGYGYFEHPKHVFKLMGKKIMTILCSNILPNWTSALVLFYIFSIVTILKHLEKMLTNFAVPVAFINGDR